MRIVIVSPALADANNGNWRTAQRWQRFLAALGPVRVVSRWPDADAGRDEVMLALHARRSAEAIRAWHAAHGARGLGVVMTGTDLHRDLPVSPEAQASLRYAQAVVVLHERGLAALPDTARAKARVILQSATARQTRPKTRQRLTAVIVGHLRPEKSPETIFDLAHRLRNVPGLRLVHLGAALDPDLARLAEATMQACPGYRWRGALPHATVRAAIQRAHLLIHPSRMEGGANVVIEAVTSGTPVLASAVEGNIGLLGEDYPGYFPWGDAGRLAELVLRLRREQVAGEGELWPALQAGIAARARSLTPECEKARVQALAHELAGVHL